MPLFRHLLKIACATLVTFVPLQQALAQSVLSEPDFSGMYSTNGYARSVARDSERGWTYIAGAYLTHLNGVQTNGAISRVNDAGFVDQDWRTNADFRSDSVGQMMVTSSGVLLVQKAAIWMRALPVDDGTFALRSLNLPGASFGSYGLTRGAEGYIYGIQGSGNDNWVRRLLPSGEYDSGWNMRLDPFPLRAVSIAVSGDGSVTYIEARYAQSPVTYSIVKRSSSGGLLWRQPVSGEPRTITLDEFGQSYIAGTGLTIDGRSVDLLRLRPTGEIDSQWAASPNLRNASLIAPRLFDGRLLVFGWRQQVSESIPEIVSLSAADGTVIARDRLPDNASLEQLDIGADGSVATSGRAVSLHKFAPSTGTTYRSSTLSSDIGGAARVSQITRWRDGYVVAGDFRYWYDGVRYDNLMRLDATLKPDAGWRPVVGGASLGVSPINVLATNSRGHLLIGGGFTLGTKRNLARFVADGTLNESWSPNPNGTIQQLVSAADGLLFVGGNFSEIGGVQRLALARYDQTDRLDSAWAASLPWVGGSLGITDVVDTVDSGVLIRWYLSNFENSTSGTARLDRAGSGTELSYPLAPPYCCGRLAERDGATGRIFVVEFVGDPAIPVSTPAAARVRLTRRLPQTLAVDPSWPPLVFSGYARVSGFDANFVYVTDTTTGTVRVNKLTGLVDGSWTLPQPSIQSFVPVGASSKWLAVGYAQSSGYGSRPYAIDTASSTNEQREVVEYFARANGHFFMTARPAEQAQLDDLPVAFVRTGMHFSVIDGRTAPTSQSQLRSSPVCRFFAPTERGGSSTHFYGRQADCQLLNTLGGLNNEGYDFATPSPATPSPQTGTCPSNAQAMVYRMFNNQSANNNSNHRYVVSQTRIAEMKSRGWVYEGIAFCATFATDTRGFGQW